MKHSNLFFIICIFTIHFTNLNAMLSRHAKILTRSFSTSKKTVTSFATSSKKTLKENVLTTPATENEKKRDEWIQKKFTELAFQMRKLNKDYKDLKK